MIEKTPSHLGRAGKKLYRDLVSEYGITDGGGLALITTAAECLDRMRNAQRAIKQHGELTADRYGTLKANPAVNIERDARNGFMTALRALNLDVVPKQAGPGRPPDSFGWKGNK